MLGYIVFFYFCVGLALFLNWHEQLAEKKTEIQQWVNRGDICVAGTHFQLKGWWGKKSRMEMMCSNNSKRLQTNFFSFSDCQTGTNMGKAVSPPPPNWFQGGSGCWLMKWGAEGATVCTTYPQSHAAFYSDWTNHPTVALWVRDCRGKRFLLTPSLWPPITSLGPCTITSRFPRMSPPWSSL